MNFSIKYFFSKCDQIGRKLWIWSHLLKKSLMENFIFCALILIQKGCIYPIRAAARPGVNEIQNSFDKH